MKKLQLVWLQLLSTLRESKLISFVFIVSSVFCSLSFLYCYGNLVGYMGHRASELRYDREYQIHLKDSGIEDIAVLIQKLETLYSEDVEEIALCTSLREDMFLYASLDNNGKWVAQDGRVSFSQEELTAGSSVVIAPRSRGTKGGKYFVNSVGYEVIGVHSSAFEYRIPLRNYIDNSYKPDYATVITSRVPDSELNDRLLAAVHDQFPDSSVFSPFLLTNFYLRRMPSDVLILCAMYALSVLSFLFLLIYLVKKTYKDFIVCHIVGASKFTIASFLLLEILLLNLFSSGAATALHILLYDIVFTKINFTAPLYYTPLDYCLVGLASLIVSILIQIPFVLSFCKNTVAVQRLHHM